MWGDYRQCNRSGNREMEVLEGDREEEEQEQDSHKELTWKGQILRWEKIVTVITTNNGHFLRWRTEIDRTRTRENPAVILYTSGIP